MPRSRRHSRSESGAALVEFALIASLLILIVFGLIDYGDAQNDIQALRQGAREVARAIATNPAQFTSEADLANYVASRTGLPSSRLAIDWTPTGNVSRGATMRVCVRYDLNALTGIAKPFLPSTVTSDIAMKMETPATGFPAPSQSISPC